jgi:hypothetical protein
METSLKYLMSNCSDFEEEESLLQSMGRQMGAIVDRTPKCSWACSKNEYRRKPLSEKRKKETFRDTVRACLSQDVLTTERIRAFSKRAREFICAYHVIHQEARSRENTTAQVDVTTDQNVAVPVKIEALAKQFKTHRCALDFDHGFVRAAIIKTEHSYVTDQIKKQRQYIHYYACLFSPKKIYYSSSIRLIVPL